MTIIRYNNKDVILAPDLSIPLSTEKSERIQGDLQVVEQTSDLLALINTRIDTLVQRMNDFESGAGTEWAVPVQNEKDARIAGDLENKTLTNGLNTAMNHRVDGLFTDINAVEDRVTVLEQDDTTIVRQCSTATLEHLKVNQEIAAQSASFTNGVSVGSLTNLSDRPWTKVQDEGDNQGMWLKRQGDLIYLRVKLNNSGASVAERWVGILPDWAQLPGATALMFSVPVWNTTTSTVSNLHIHGNLASDPNRNKVAILKNVANQKYEFEISYAVGTSPS